MIGCELVRCEYLMRVAGVMLSSDLNLEVHSASRPDLTCTSVCSLVFEAGKIR